MNKTDFENALKEEDRMYKTEPYNKFTRPSHYCFSNIEPKDAIRDWGLNFNLGNVVKYVVRAGKKENILDDLRKAMTYLNFEIEAIEEERTEANDNCKII